MPKIMFLGYPHSKEGFAETERRKGKVDRTCVQSVLVYGSEMWAIKETAYNQACWMLVSVSIICAACDK